MTSGDAGIQHITIAPLSVPVGGSEASFTQGDVSYFPSSPSTGMATWTTKSSGPITDVAIAHNAEIQVAARIEWTQIGGVWYSSGTALRVVEPDGYLTEVRTVLSTPTQVALRTTIPAPANPSVEEGRDMLGVAALLRTLAMPRALHAQGTNTDTDCWHFRGIGVGRFENIPTSLNDCQNYAVNKMLIPLATVLGSAATWAYANREKLAAIIVGTSKLSELWVLLAAANAPAFGVAAVGVIAITGAYNYSTCVNKMQADRDNCTQGGGEAPRAAVPTPGPLGEACSLMCGGIAGTVDRFWGTADAT
jgi:hypothetical protein